MLSVYLLIGLIGPVVITAIMFKKGVWTMDDLKKEVSDFQNPIMFIVAILAGITVNMILWPINVICTIRSFIKSTK